MRLCPPTLRACLFRGEQEGVPRLGRAGHEALDVVRTTAAWTATTSCSSSERLPSISSGTMRHDGETGRGHDGLPVASASARAADTPTRTAVKPPWP